MMSSERNKQLARDFFDALNRGDVPAILDAYADDGYCLTMGNTLISGKFGKAQIAQAAGGIFDVFPNGIHFTIKAMTADDDRVAVQDDSEGAHVSGATYRHQKPFFNPFRDATPTKFNANID